MSDLGDWENSTCSKTRVSAAFVRLNAVSLVTRTGMQRRQEALLGLPGIVHATPKGSCYLAVISILYNILSTMDGVNNTCLMRPVPLEGIWRS